MPKKAKEKTSTMGFRCADSLKRAVEIISSLEGQSTSDYINSILAASVSDYLSKNNTVADLLKSKGIEI